MDDLQPVTKGSQGGKMNGLGDGTPLPIMPTPSGLLIVRSRY
jgi:hypothetical protein